MFGSTRAKYQYWAAKQAGNPKLVLVSVLCFTAASVIAYRSFYKPWARKKKLEEADQIAQFVYQAEIKNK